MIAETLTSTSSHSATFKPLHHHYATEIFYAAPCDVGVGVFANRDIVPGESILEFGGPIIDFAETKRRGPSECMAIQIGEDRYFDTRAPGVLVNHSCSPNAGIRWDRRLVALGSIRKGGEIRFDYSTTMQEQSYTMNCLCGEPNCRGVIGDFTTLPTEVQHRYLRLGIVMSFIVKHLAARAAGHHPATALPRRSVANRPELVLQAR